MSNAYDRGVKTNCQKGGVMDTGTCTVGQCACHEERTAFLWARDTKGDGRWVISETQEAHDSDHMCADNNN